MKTLPAFRIHLTTCFLCLTAMVGPLHAKWQSVTNTPYDSQIGSVYAYVKSTSRRNTADIGEANRILSRLRSYRHVYTRDWKLPGETKSSRRGDCKAKCILFIDEFRKVGGGSLTMIIGKRRPDSPQTHVWLIWEHEGETYLIDPSFESRVKKLSQTPSRYYQGDYAYRGGKKYAHLGDEIILAHR